MLAVRSLQSPAYRDAIAIIIAARKRVGLTQQPVADRLGKPQSWLAKVEGCERRLDLAEFIALARAMDMEPAALFDEVLRGSGRADAAMRT